jgi:RNA polymerase sigma factor (sigma-70 family)
MTEPQTKARVEQLHRRESAAIHAYLRLRLRGDEELVCEVLNQVFVEAWQKIERGESDPSRALLKTMGKRRAIDALRSKSNSRTILSATGDIEREHPGADVISTPIPRDPLAVVLSNEFAEEFWKSLRKTGAPEDRAMDKLRLTSTEHSVLVLAWLDGQSNVQIARQLRISQRAVETHKSRAKRKVRKLVKIPGYTIDTWPDESAKALSKPAETTKNPEGNSCEIGLTFEEELGTRCEEGQKRDANEEEK